MKKRSFFERLSGSVPQDEYGFDDDFMPAEQPVMSPVRRATPQQMMGGQQPQPMQASPMAPSHATIAALEEEPAEGSLPVDVYQTPSEIVIRAFIAGVRPDDISLSISRDMVVIEGARDPRTQIADSDYFRQELFWGSFSTTILLPQEIDVDNSSAGAKDGLLTLILPKLDKARQTKLKVKAG